MADSEDGGRRRRRGPDIFAVQLRHFDGQVADFRAWYDGFPAEDKARIRAWLERVEALAREGCEWSALLEVRTEYDECDADGDTLRWADVRFSPSTTLAAIRAWDAGEEYTPPGIQP
jgi:hypothetical protein